MKHSLTYKQGAGNPPEHFRSSLSRDRKVEKVLPLRLGHRACLKPRDCSRKAKSPSHSPHSPHPPLTWHRAACSRGRRESRQETCAESVAGILRVPTPSTPDLTEAHGDSSQALEECGACGKLSTSLETKCKTSLPTNEGE